MCLSNQEHKGLIEYHQGSWTQLAKDPESWLRKAEALKNAADSARAALWPKNRKHNDTKAALADFFQGPVYMLLAGLAVETLIKGIIVAKKPKAVEKQRLSKKLTHRNLQKLYRTASLRENNSRNDLFLRLQNYVENFGRYPVTRTKQDMKKMLHTRFASQTDPDKIERLWKFLVQEIQSHIQPWNRKEQGESKVKACIRKGARQ